MAPPLGDRRINYVNFENMNMPKIYRKFKSTRIVPDLTWIYQFVNIMKLRFKNNSLYARVYLG